MISFTQQPAPNVLVNNPVFFRILSDTEHAIIYEVIVGDFNGNLDISVFNGNLFPVSMDSSMQYECTLNISCLLKPWQFITVLHGPNPASSHLAYFYRQYRVIFRKNNETLTFDGRFYQGGISKKMLRFLNEKNTEIFAWKLLNTGRQFFMTTRTAGRHIFIRENELSPLCFIAQNKTYRIETEKGHYFLFYGIVASGEVQTINLDIIREHIFQSYDYYPCFLELLIDGKVVCDITIIESARSPHKYVIEFLNSYSVWEKIEVSGNAISEPEFSENNAFMLYDQEIDDYTEHNNRISLREIINAECGYKTLDEFMFIRDMLQSDLRYLISPDGQRQEVRVFAENFSHDLFQIEPASAHLKIRLIDTDSNYSPEIDESDLDVEAFETAIEFEVTITSQAGYPVSLLAIAGDPNYTYTIDYGDGTGETKSFEAPVLVSTGTPGTPEYHTYLDNPVSSHTYMSPGVYNVKIDSPHHISNVKFTTLNVQSGEWLYAPSTVTHITKIIKFYSNSITNINYAFAGLTHCCPGDDFIIDCQKVTTAVAAFHSFGTVLPAGQTGFWSFRHDLLSKLTLLTNLNNMFRQCGMRDIPVGFFDSQILVTELFETFKRSRLGVRYYEGWTLHEVVDRNLAGTSFIPMSLFRNMPNLKSLYATFNALEITDRVFGDLEPGTFGNWARPCLLIRAELFWNGRDRGNLQSTIEQLYLTFGKMNELAVEKDLFRYCYTSLKDISGIFTQCHWPRSMSLSQSILYGWEPALNAAWLGVATMNLQEVLGPRQFPYLATAISAFSVPLQDYGFNGIFGSDAIIAPDSIPLDNTITAHFPNIKRTPGYVDVWSYNTGLDGMLTGLRFDPALTPTPDTTIAMTGFPIWYN